MCARSLVIILLSFLSGLMPLASYAVTQSTCLAVAHSTLMKPSLDPEVAFARAKALMDRYFLTRSFVPISDSQDVAFLKRYFRISESEGVRALPPKDRMKIMNGVFEQLSKMPVEQREFIAQAGSGVELVVDSVVEHQKLADKKGKVIQQYRNGGTWDSVSGASKDGISVIAGRGGILNRKHGSKNLVLHEHGHSFEAAFKFRSGEVLSKSPGFLKAWKASRWNNFYCDDYSEEAFAEAYAMFYDSALSRNELHAKHPQLHEYFVDFEVKLKGALPKTKGRETLDFAKVISRAETELSPAVTDFLKETQGQVQRFIPFRDSTDAFQKGESWFLVRAGNFREYHSYFGKGTPGVDGITLMPPEVGAQARFLPWDEVGEVYYVNSPKLPARVTKKLSSQPWARFKLSDDLHLKLSKGDEFVPPSDELVGLEMSFLDEKGTLQRGLLLGRDYRESTIEYLDLKTGTVKTRTVDVGGALQGFVRKLEGEEWKKLESLVQKAKGREAFNFSEVMNRMESDLPPAAADFLRKVQGQVQKFDPFRDSVSMLRRGENWILVKSGGFSNSRLHFGKGIASKEGVTWIPQEPGGKRAFVSWDDVDEMYYVDTKNADASQKK